MRITLIIGAVLSSIIGFFTIENYIGWLRFGWWRLLSEPQGRDLATLFLGVIFTILAFIPAIMLFCLRKVEKLKWRFFFIGANELLVVGMYANTLLKYFVAWAN